MTNNRVEDQSDGDPNDEQVGSKSTFPTGVHSSEQVGSENPLPTEVITPSETPSSTESAPSEQEDQRQGDPDLTWVEQEDQGQGDPDLTWVSLREAVTVTGASKSTLRKWYRSGKVKSQTVEGHHGPEKRVILEEIQELAARREITPPPEPAPAATVPAASEPGEEESPTTLKLVEALTDLAGKYAEAEGRAQRAEQKVEHLENRLREQRAEHLESGLPELRAETKEVKQPKAPEAATPAAAAEEEAVKEAEHRSEKRVRWWQR